MVMFYDLPHTDKDSCHLFQGCLPTVARAMVVNAAQLATYSQAKQALLSTSKKIHISYVRYQRG